MKRLICLIFVFSPLFLKSDYWNSEGVMSVYYTDFADQGLKIPGKEGDRCITSPTLNTCEGNLLCIGTEIYDGKIYGGHSICRDGPTHAYENSELPCSEVSFGTCSSS